jgi:hypothetical protein
VTRAAPGLVSAHRDCREPHGASTQSEVTVGRFLLGFVVAIILVVYLAARCVNVIH